DKARAEGTPFRSESRLLARDGRPVWVRDEARASREGEATQEGLLLDVTEMRELEERVRRVQKLDAVGRLAGGVAHDFNNILTAILSFSRFIHQDLGPNHPSRPDVEEIIRSGERAAALTRQLLTFSRKDVFEAT